MSATGWSWKLPERPCHCPDCNALFRAAERSSRTEDMCRFLMGQAIHANETTSITDPDGHTMAFRPLFVLTPGSAWDRSSDVGYSDAAYQDSEAPGTEVYLSDLLELDIPAGVN